MADDRRTQHVPGSMPAGRGSTDNDRTQFLGKAQAVGQLEIVEGPGVGNRLQIADGTNALGRDPEKNRLAVDYGDAMIGRSQHALIICDAPTRTFGIQANGHPNPILLNGATVTARMPLAAGDRIKIGQTTFKFLG